MKIIDTTKNPDSKSMSFRRAILVLANLTTDDAQYRIRTQGNGSASHIYGTALVSAKQFAAFRVADETGVDEDWIANGSYDGTETASQIRRQWNELNEQS